MDDWCAEFHVHSKFEFVGVPPFNAMHSPSLNAAQDADLLGIVAVRP